MATQTNWAPPFDISFRGPLTAANQVFFQASRAYKILGVQAIWSTLSTNVTVDIQKDTGTTAPGSGTTQLTGTIDTSTTANTTNTPTLIATPTLAAGDRLTAVVAGSTPNAFAGLVITVRLQPN